MRIRTKTILVVLPLIITPLVLLGIASFYAARNGITGVATEFLAFKAEQLASYADSQWNVLEQNGRFGISIGHKDSDNLLRRNQSRLNKSNGVFFRNESLGMAAHRNRLENNIIEDNGDARGTAGVRVRGETNGLVFRGNVIRDTRQGDRQTQTVGFLVEEQVGELVLALQGEMSREALQTTLGLQDRKSFRERYLRPALADGLIEMTIPDKPNSRLQKYRLTDKGRQWPAGQRKNSDK